MKSAKLDNVFGTSKKSDNIGGYMNISDNDAPTDSPMFDMQAPQMPSMDDAYIRATRENAIESLARIHQCQRIKASELIAEAEKLTNWVLYGMVG